MFSCASLSSSISSTQCLFFVRWALKKCRPGGCFAAVSHLSGVKPPSLSCKKENGNSVCLKYLRESWNNYGNDRKELVRGHNTITVGQSVPQIDVLCSGNKYKLSFNLLGCIRKQSPSAFSCAKLMTSVTFGKFAGMVKPTAAHLWPRWPLLWRVHEDKKPTRLPVWRCNCVGEALERSGSGHRLLLKPEATNCG